MTSIIEAKRAISELGTKAKRITENTSLAPAQQMAQLDSLQEELKTYQAIIDTDATAKRLMSGGESIGRDAAALDGLGVARKGAVVPRLDLDIDALKEAFTRIKGGGNFRAELGVKDAASSSTTVGQLPADLLGIVGKRHEPTRILELLPSTPMAGPSVEYVQHSSTTGSAGPVSAGATMNEATLTTTALIATAQKLGIFTTLTDELLADFTTFYQYAQNELQRLIIDAENNQLLNGTGTAPQIKGLLQTSGTITRAKGAENIIDTLEMAVNDLRVGASYCEPDALILNPSDWSLIRRTKATGTGQYMLGDPGQSAVTELWGVPVATTTQIAAGTGILANLGMAATAFIREGITLEMTNSAGTDFQSGLVKVRATERLTLGVVRPSAINVITGIA